MNPSPPQPYSQDVDPPPDFRALTGEGKVALAIACGLGTLYLCLSIFGVLVLVTHLEYALAALIAVALISLQKRLARSK